MADLEEREPDPNGWVPNDNEGLVLVESSAVADGDVLRVAVMLRPNSDMSAHWNNEAGPTQLWLDAPDGWVLGQRLHMVPNPGEEISEEPRRFEFEIGRGGGGGEAAVLRGYTVYFACKGDTGVCMSRRQHVEVTLAG